MSSPKGDKYEAFVMDVLKSEIEKGKLPFPVGQTTLTPKKKYRARRGNDIEVDVAIEVFRDPTKKPFLITLVECKDYAKPIDTMRIGDLYNKMGLIGAHKGIIFTTSGCQSGVIREAEFYNIGIARLNYGDDEPLYEVERSTTSARNLYRSIVLDGEWPETGFVGLSEHEAYTSLCEYIYEGIIKSDPRPTIPFVTIERIEQYANLLAEKCKIGYDPRLLDITLFEVLTFLNYTVENIESDNFLGKCDFKNRKIYISNELEIGSPRWRFTFAHEIGHILLHRKYFVNDCLQDDNQTLFGGVFSSADHKRLEIQANKFASYFLMPNRLFCERYFRAYDYIGIPKRIFPKIYVDDQPVNVKDFNDLLSFISKVFGVSKQTVEIRLRNLKLIEDYRKHCSDSLLDFLL
ncbi:ImmA/IrrE family metallo-endopeptidase [Alistipes sp. Z76]|nr:ImmA/IrrE family metallo-endopeptidase [Alistipes sp. Z76]NCE69733.1 ImmA/IrrE family metallo-endopeptidase [Muribaculaceae bacterium M3]